MDASVSRCSERAERLPSVARSVWLATRGGSVSGSKELAGVSSLLRAAQASQISVPDRHRPVGRGGLLSSVVEAISSPYDMPPDDSLCRVRAVGSGLVQKVLRIDQFQLPAESAQPPSQLFRLDDSRAELVLTP